MSTRSCTLVTRTSSKSDQHASPSILAQSKPTFLDVELVIAANTEETMQNVQHLVTTP